MERSVLMPYSKNMANNAREYVKMKQSCPFRADEL